VSIAKVWQDLGQKLPRQENFSPETINCCTANEAAKEFSV
jgi:hypothetical protein